LEGLGRVFVALLTPVLTFYILKDVVVIKRTIANLMPGKHRRKLLAWLSKIDASLGSWIRGQLLIAFMVGVLSTVGLSIIGLDFAILLGVLAGMLDVIPYFGPLIGGIPPVVVGILVSPAMGIKTLAVIIVVQQIENNLITPQILGHSLGLHPLLVIFALLLGGEIGGLVGMVLSVPIAAIIKTTIEHLASGD
ncbi:MAG: AI-2E family transporter, partial [Bacillota bacterium]|nr:AI-2E family transporter [Bacillota bacterium]